MAQTDIKPSELAQTYFAHEGLNCTEAVLKGVLDALEIDYPAEILALTHGFGNGIAGSGCVCGALNGGVMAVSYLNALSGHKRSTRAMARTLYNKFVERNRCTCCRILSKRFPKGSEEAHQQCINFVGEVAHDVMELVEIDIETLAKK